MESFSEIVLFIWLLRFNTYVFVLFTTVNKCIQVMLEDMWVNPTETHITFQLHQLYGYSIIKDFQL